MTYYKIREHNIMIYLLSMRYFADHMSTYQLNHLHAYISTAIHYCITELDEYLGCFIEDGPEACESEINVRTI